MSSFLTWSALSVLLLASALPAAGKVNPEPVFLPLPSVGGGATVPVHPELYRLWESLPGDYESADQSTPLRLSLRAVSPYVVFLEARTKSGGKEILERGFVHLGDASPSYRSQKKRFSLTYRPETLGMNFFCTFYGAPSGGGVRFETEGSDCSFPLKRPISKWTIDTSAAELTVTDAKTGQATVLRKIPTASDR